MGQSYLAITNPAAGGGRGGKLLGTALNRLRDAGLEVKVATTHSRGHATEIARDAYHQGTRHFIAVGGDGTSYEVVNGLFPQALGKEPPTLGFLPLGTGNSFLRDFSDRGVEHAIESLIASKTRSCDVMRMRHRAGEIYFINLLSMGFSADVATLRARRFSHWGELGYFTSIFLTLARFNRRSFPVRVEGQEQFDDRRCLFVTFNNSKFTGGTMMIAPRAQVGDGLVEYVRWGPIGRLGLIRNLPGLYDGSHIQHPLAECKAVRRVEFKLGAPVDVMVDGEVLSLYCEQLDVLPGALNVVA
ncbi:MAG TPA: diacylglycerol kinase family protein [Candidatus Sulfotelmatobacter sp.]|nr:diacylglycerol kinase family protein [Candidatus Sulfotelmatobacter sp.]